MPPRLYPARVPGAPPAGLRSSPEPTGKRRAWLAAAALAVATTALWHAPPGAAAGAADEPPNILFVLTDDQRVDTMGMMPRTRKAFGVTFRQYVVTTSNCCPSRSTYLTGQYVHDTGVFTSDAAGYEAFEALAPESLAPWLQAQGYYTGFVGKYFNGVRREDGIPPGWDEFYGRLYGADRGNGTTEFTLREFRRAGGGVVRDEIVAYPNEEHPEPYATRVFGEKAEAFLRRAADPSSNPGGKPFALFLWTTAVNTGAPEPLYADAPLPRWRKPPSFLERDLRDKPKEIRRSSAIVDSAPHHARVRANQLRQLPTVDDVVGDVLAVVDEVGLSEDTWGFFTSDNGRFWGEHRLEGKVYAYEESIRVPFRIMTPAGTRMAIDAPAANIDLAPTVVALAGDPSSHSFDGRSLLPLLADPEADFRWDVLLEHFGRGARVRFDGLRNARWTYVRWPASGREELYDRRTDPHQLENLAERRKRLTGIFARRVAVLARS